MKQSQFDTDVSNIAQKARKFVFGRCYWLLLGVVGWLKTEETRHWRLNNLLISQAGASVVCCRTVHNHNSLAPCPHAGQQPGHTLFNQHLSQVSQCGCVGHSGMNSTPKLIPQVFNGVEVRTASRPFHPLHSSSACSLWETPYGIATGCRISSWFLSVLRIPPVMTSLIFPVREMLPHPITKSLHQKMLHHWCSNQYGILHVSSTRWPYDPTAVGRITEHNVPPHVQDPVRVLSTPVRMGLTVRCSHGRPPGRGEDCRKLPTVL